MDTELHEYLHLNRQIELRAAWHIRHSNRKGAAGEGGAVGNTEVLDRPPVPSLSLSLLFWWSALNCLYSYSASSSATVTTIRHVGWHWRHGQGPSEYPSPSPGPDSSALSNGFEQFDGSTCARPRHNSQHFPSVRLCVQLSSATTPIWHLTWAHVWWKICQSRAAAREWGEQREGSQHWSLLQFACSFALSVSMLANLRIWMIGGSFCSLSFSSERSTNSSLFILALPWFIAN